MRARFCVVGLAVLAAACSTDKGMRCDYSAGNLDAIKAQVASLKAGGTTAAEVVKSLGKPAGETPTPDGGTTYEYDFPQALSSDSSPGCPVKTQKVTFIFDPRQILQSMQINF